MSELNFDESSVATKTIGVYSWMKRTKSMETHSRHVNDLKSENRITIGAFISLSGEVVFKPICIDKSVPRKLEVKRTLFSNQDNKLKLIEKKHSVNKQYNLLGQTPKGYMTR